MGMSCHDQFPRHTGTFGDIARLDLATSNFGSKFSDLDPDRRIQPLIISISP